MTSPARLAVTLLAGAALGLVVLATAFGQTHVRMRYGGTLVVGLGYGEPDALDPTRTVSLASVEVFRTICERLYDFDSKAQVVPELAAALPLISKDRRTYTIALRRGVVFNDGTPFNAQAVVTTIERDQTLPGSVRASDLSPIDSVTATGPYTVVLHLSAPFAPLLDTLGTATGMIMSPTQLDKLGANFATHPICVGPFMFDHRVAGDNVTVIKSPYYYDKKDVYLDKIVFKVENDAAAAAAALEAGDLQALDLVSPTALPGVKLTAGLRLYRQTQLGFQAITFNIGNKRGVGHLPYENLGTPFASNFNLRKAFDEAIDRKAVGKAVLDGEVVAGCTPVSPVSAWFDGTVSCPRYNRTDAKRLVRASGVPSPTVHLLTSNVTDTLRLAQAIQAVEAAVGINVVLEMTDSTTRDTRAATGNFDVYLGPAWSGSVQNPDANIYKFLATTGSRNWSGYSNPKVDALLDNARQAPTVSAQKALYHAAEQIMVNDRPMIVLYHAIKYAAANKRVTGVKLYPDVQLRVAFAQFK